MRTVGRVIVAFLVAALLVGPAAGSARAQSPDAGLSAALAGSMRLAGP